MVVWTFQGGSLEILIRMLSDGDKPVKIGKEHGTNYAVHDGVRIPRI